MRQSMIDNRKVGSDRGRCEYTLISTLWLVMKVKHNPPKGSRQAFLFSLLSYVALRLTPLRQSSISIL